MEEKPKRRRGRPRRETVVVNGSELATVARPLALDQVPVPDTFLSAEAEAGAVPMMIRSCLDIRAAVNLENPATLWEAMNKYVTLCSMSGMKISNSMLYLSCGISRETISDWITGKRRKDNPEYKKFALMCRELCGAAREQYGIEGKVNPILTIFHQKFYDGLKDAPAPDAPDDPLGEIQDPVKLAEKYKDIIID